MIQGTHIQSGPSSLSKQTHNHQPGAYKNCLYSYFIEKKEAWCDGPHPGRK